MRSRLLLCLLVALGCKRPETHGRHDGAQQEEQAEGWTGKRPFTCGGDERVTIESVTAAFPSTTVAITASGNCRLTLKDVNAKGRMALFAGGNAVVDVTGGSLEGTDFSISAGGAAKVVLHNVKVVGSTQHAGSATIEGEAP